ncbi:flagellar hook associated protein lafW [Yersinia pekkanenii]|uniref:Flagellar hook associated protein lafW n=1 Tax=Yersinia pekkanenii TaxID=1288385 RepID=A0A0T9P4E4_9GAMM|nr:flagellar hook associated protein lafW [Yersinia pekkanenii]
MQVGFNRTQWEMANNARLPGFDKFQGADSLTSVPKNATFPESPFISNQPLRYNVQLNRQLTAVQRAEKYLYTTELQVAQLQRVLQQEGHNNEIKSTALKTLHWLQQRVSVSGNTIDRQLNFVADQRTEVNFNLHQVDKLLQPAESETLLFSLAGAEHRIVAVKLSADASATQNLLRLNNGLGRFGLHGAVDSHGNVQFRVDEQSWADIHADLQVRGGGGGHTFFARDIPVDEITARKGTGGSGARYSRTPTDSE